MNYLLDTNVISELVARQPNQKVVDWVDSLDPSTVYLSVITIGEIRKGIERATSPQRKAALTTWFYSDLLVRFDGKVAEITSEVALVWGELIGQLEARGQSLPALDSRIAATALAGKYTIVTRNDQDFIPSGAAVINPWTQP
jgi:tRNA(fMet)-specific endonuclease VapC